MINRLLKSRTIIGALVLALSVLSHEAGVDLDEGRLTEIAQALVEAAGLMLVVIGRLKAKGPIL